MPQSLVERAQLALKYADRLPFDSSDEWYEVAADANEGDSTQPSPARDWAHRAARGIIEELRHDRGAALETAFHRERVDQESRVELTEIIAEVIRQAHAGQR